MCFSTLGHISASWQRGRRQKTLLGRKGDGNEVSICLPEGIFRLPSRYWLERLLEFKGSYFKARRSTALYSRPREQEEPVQTTGVPHWHLCREQHPVRAGTLACVLKNMNIGFFCCMLELPESLLSYWNALLPDCSLSSGLLACQWCACVRRASASPAGRHGRFHHISHCCYQGRKIMAVGWWRPGGASL